MEDPLARLAANRDRLNRRAEVLRLIRTFFFAEGFLEVTTPVLSPTLIPEEHIEPIACEGGFLLPSPELHMKGLLAAGYEKIFQIGPVFRRGERGRFHLPEFTLLEWYRAGADYEALIRDCEQLLAVVARKLFRSLRIPVGNAGIDLTPPWPRMRIRDAFQRVAGWDPIEQRSPDRFEEDFALRVIPALDPGRPTLLLEFPEYEASLARRKAEDPRVAERVELFAGGLELANGFTELVDPREQRFRFEQVNRSREKSGRKAFALPEMFLAWLPALKPCAGMALGVDRLVMLFSGADRIEDVIAWVP